METFHEDQHYEKNFKSIFTNIVLLNQIFNHVRTLNNLYKKNKTKSFYDYQELCEYPELKYIEELKYSGEIALKKGDLPSDGVLKVISLFRKNSFCIKGDAIPHGVEVLGFENYQDNKEPTPFWSFPSSIHTVRNPILQTFKNEEEAKNHITLPSNITSLSFMESPNISFGVSDEDENVNKSVSNTQGNGFPIGAPSYSSFNTVAGNGFGTTSGTGFIATSGTGFNATSGTGFSANSGGGFNTNSGAGFNANSGTGFNANSGTGFNTNSGTGFNANSGTGFNATSGTGFSANSGTGFSATSGTGFSANSGGGFSATSRGGFVGPSNSKENGGFVIIPNTIKSLSFMYMFKRPLKKGDLPESITELDIVRNKLDIDVTQGVLPTSIKSLKIGTGKGYQSLIGLDQLENLSLFLVEGLTEESGLVNFESITKLSLGMSNNNGNQATISLNSLPKNLTELTLNSMCSKIEPNSIPNLVKTMSIGFAQPNNPNQTLVQNSLPNGLLSLTIDKLVTVSNVFPQSLTSLVVISNGYFKTHKKSYKEDLNKLSKNLPESLTYLSLPLEFKEYATTFPSKVNVEYIFYNN